MFTVLACEYLGTKRAKWTLKGHATSLEEAVSMAVEFAEYLGISTDERLVRSSIQTYGKYRHYVCYPHKVWGKDAVLVVPGRK